MKILVACEESQAITKELRALGHDAYSCDLLPCSGGHPEWHFNYDVFQVIEENGGTLQNGSLVNDGLDWELMIAHPPCTFLAVSGARWYYHPDDSGMPTSERRPHPRFPDRAEHREEAVEFFIRLCEAPIEKIAVENPVGIISTRYRKPNQTVHPWMFGDEASKSTCLWLKNLPLLEATDIVGKGERVVLSSGKSLPKWYSDALTNAKSSAERRTLRSKTFKGMAEAMALQWTVQ
ncbi:hypothetical protein [Ulvibacter antarcticus]|uniref:DNA (Cytosine-5)-methyltransferase 1 n=1 Tax=Ulvibacter antarcticus TaxID=442714 RepID=A0A3L9Z4J8_9FLAO|nr:hypothetical protein [Ulvibacter antarcticus]RMA66379.1 hypothetical protein BXY75_0801 [Ulvibacter antarcticus]